MASADDPRDDVRDDTPDDGSHDAPDAPPVAVPNDPARTSPKRRGFFRRHWLGILVTILVVVPIAGIFLWVTATLAYSYSSGDRAGYNQKLSRRGWLCKTWEGELAISSAPGVAPEIFRYTVRDDSVAQVIQSLAGERVTLYYEQHKGVPSSCFGDTEYFVTRVQKSG